MSADKADKAEALAAGDNAHSPALTDEYFAGRVAELNRLQSVEEDLQAQIHRYLQNVREASESPGRHGSIGEYKEHLARAEETQRLAEKGTKQAEGRLIALADNRRRILEELKSAGLPEDEWFRFGEYGNLLRSTSKNGELEVRRALWEAVLKSPPDAPPAQVEELSNTIASYRSPGLLGKVSLLLREPFFVPILVLSLLGFCGVAIGFFAIVRDLDPRASAIVTCIHVFTAVLACAAYLTLPGVVILCATGVSFYRVKSSLWDLWQVARPVPKHMRGTAENRRRSASKEAGLPTGRAPLLRRDR